MKRSALALTLLLSLGATSAFAKASDCRNPSQILIDENVTMKFCSIPSSGVITKGQGPRIGSENGDPNEVPVKPRKFKSFEIGQYAVTQLQYKTVTGEEPWKDQPDVIEGDSIPATYVSYNDAKLFIRILNLIDKTATYRLPTEAEFEYAARAGTKTDYFWGDKFNLDYAFHLVGSARPVDSCPNENLSQKNPGYCANQFGLYNILGNVGTLTADAYEIYGYTNAPMNGNQVITSNLDAANTLYSVRGGGFNHVARDLRSANRSNVTPDAKIADIGLRVVRLPK